MKCEVCGGAGLVWDLYGVYKCEACQGSGKMPEPPSEKDVDALVSAVWQILDDMGEGGKCVCGAAKAYARRALEPFLDEEGKRELSYTLEQANALIRQLEKGE